MEHISTNSNINATENEFKNNIVKGDEDEDEGIIKEDDHHHNGSSSMATTAEESSVTTTTTDKQSQYNDKMNNGSASSNSKSHSDTMTDDNDNDQENDNHALSNGNMKEIISNSSLTTTQKEILDVDQLLPHINYDNYNKEWGARSLDIYETLEQIGEGTFGQVYRAKNKVTGNEVALKRVMMENETEGFPITAIREIKILKELNNVNVVKLHEIVTSKHPPVINGQPVQPTTTTNTAANNNNNKGNVYMVFEYMDHDLNGLMDSPHFKFFQPEQIKCYLKQLLEGLHYCHNNNVLHRDIKGSNLLVNNHGILKLADFGLARPYNSNETNKKLTNKVITLWYRPPELLLGSQQYGPEIDMWSVGCIMSELLFKKTLFPGRSPIDQLDKIFQICGTPTPENWPDASSLPFWNKLQPSKHINRNLRELCENENKIFFTPEALDLLDRLLCLDPKKRITAVDALDSPYFWTNPLPCNPNELPKYQVSCHEFRTKKKRMQLQQQQQKQQQQAQAQAQQSNQPPPPPQQHSGSGYQQQQPPPPPPPSHPPYYNGASGSSVNVGGHGDQYSQYKKLRTDGGTHQYQGGRPYNQQSGPGHYSGGNPKYNPSMNGGNPHASRNNGYHYPPGNRDNRGPPIHYNQPPPPPSYPHYNQQSHPPPHHHHSNNNNGSHHSQQSNSNYSRNH